MGGIFISYRREDSAGHSGRIRDRLIEHYGDEAVFLDVDDIEAGDNFVVAIEESVGGCDAMLVIIGRDWLTIADATGGLRLDNEEDLVRLEIASALRRHPAMKVIPVLIGGAEMPVASDLPEPLQELALRNALEVRDARFDDDVTALIRAIGGRGQKWLGLTRRAWIGVPAVALVAVGAAVYLLPDGPGPMTGDFNIAVAEFAATGGGDSGDAADLSRTVHERLLDELEPLNVGELGFDIQVRGPSDTGRIDGDRDTRATEAAELAADIAADVVIYGILDDDGFTPEFYLEEREGNFEGAEELTGQFELGSELEAGTIAANRELRLALAARTEALARFVIGLSYYVGDDFEEALTWFAAAEAIDGWEAGQGREVLYLFIGNAAGKTGALNEAEEAYEDGIEENEDYGRVWIGLGEVYFQRSHADCEPGNADPDGLALALDAYQRALEAADQPPRSNIPAKAALGRGRAYACLSQALIADNWAEAEREFEAVVSRYEETGDKRLTELAAEAYAGLGLVALPAAGAADAAAHYCEARGWYETAQATTRYDERRETFQVFVDFVDEQVGELGASC